LSQYVLIFKDDLPAELQIRMVQLVLYYQIFISISFLLTNIVN